VPAAKRDGLGAYLKARGIPTAVYYPKPLHQQTAYSGFPCAGNGLPVSERLSHEVISLPMHPYMKDETIEYIAREVIDGLAQQA
jgi:dTDP-4-amino-4,6-dideoxygalactose transaminase